MGGVLLALLQTGPPALAVLTADQVAIIANATSPDSLAVARHYAARRGIPSDRIFSFDLPLDEGLPRADYEKRLVEPLRRALVTAGLSTTVRALVTTYGVPLRLGAPALTADEKRWLADARARVQSARSLLASLERPLAEIAPGGQAQPAVQAPEPPGAPGFILETDRSAALIGRVGRALQEAVLRVQRLQDRQEAQRWTQALTHLALRYGGRAALVSRVRSPEGGSGQPEAPLLTRWRAQVMQVERLAGLFTAAPVQKRRDEVYALYEQVFGAGGVLLLASAEVDMLAMEHADASLDSELSLLWWDPDLYRVAWRWSNPLFQPETPSRAAIEPGQGAALPVLMVSRLDAPTPELAMRMVDQALDAEQSGPEGTAYFDARGLTAASQADTYGVYDQSLRDAAGLFTAHTAHRVKLDNTERRYSEAGEAPDVAVYVGWYRLRHYEDAFTFRPGAIGYHLASAEAVSVHDPAEQGWCRNALQRGIAVTIGSIAEPYLDSFPQPHRFLGLLLTGRYTLAEAFYLTSPFISWRMVLFGDPLYNAWRRRPPLPQGDPKSESTLPPSPASLAFSEPEKTRHAQQRDRAARWAQLEELLRRLEASGEARPR